MLWQVVVTLTHLITMKAMAIMIILILILIRILLHTRILYKISLLDCLFLVSIQTLALVFIQ